MAAGTAIREFDVNNSDSWKTYIAQVEYYFFINKIEEDRYKIATLLYFAGQDMIQLANRLTDPKRLEDLPYQEFIERLNAYFVPKTSKWIARLRLRSRTQLPQEKYVDYDLALRKLAKDCEFGQEINDSLLEQFLYGMSDDKFRKVLLSDSDLNYKTAMEKCVAQEAMLNMASEYTTAKIPEKIAFSIERERNNIATSSGYSKKQTCNCCGKIGHLKNICRYKDKVCRMCNTRGHLAAVCHSRDGEYPRKKSDYKPRSEVEREVSIKAIRNDDTKLDNIRVELQICNKRMTMEVDSGAGLSIISHKDWMEIKKDWDNNLKLRKADVFVTDINGNRINIQGKATVPVTLNKRHKFLELYIVKNNISPLLGRNWFAALGIRVEILKKVRIETTIKERYPELFRPGVSEFRTRPVDIELVKDAKGIICKPRKVPFAIREKVEKELNDLVAKGVLTPTEESSWATPIVTIVKPEGSLRLCGDYRLTINKYINKGAYPVPNVREVLAVLQKAKYFAKIDLKTAFHQIPVTKETAELLTLTTHKGLYKCNKLPYGITIAPNVFQAKMDMLFRAMDGVIPYLDDILVVGETENELEKRVDQVCSKLDQAKAKLNVGKCIWSAKEIKFLGHIVTERGRRPDPEKVKAIKNARKPQSVKELQAFLGLLNFYESFLAGKSHVLSPLYMLLKKKQRWIWSTEQNKAFETAKDLLTSESLLVHYRNDWELCITADASEYGVGAVLSHPCYEGERPIAFASRVLTPAEKNYSQVDKEALAVIFAVKKFHQYAYGRKFTIYTDHRPLTGIFGCVKNVYESSSPRMLRWIDILSHYDFTLIYKPGKKISHADALSRLPDVKEITYEIKEINYIDALNPEGINSNVIAHWTRNDKGYMKLINWIRKGWPSRCPSELSHSIWIAREGLSVCNGCILNNDRVLVPTNGRKKILSLLHKGHPGIVRMKALARSYVWWPNLTKDIENTLKECVNCQQISKLPPKKFETWQAPSAPWSRIHLDHVGPLNGYIILLLVDAYSRWTEYRVVKDTSAECTIRVLNEVFATHGYPENVVTDNGAGFTSTKFKDFLRDRGIEHTLTPPYHPQSNGIAEQGVQHLKYTIKKLQLKNMSDALVQAMYTQHFTPSTSTGKTPAELLMGRKCRTHLSQLLPGNHKSRVFSTDKFLPGEDVWIYDVLKSKWIPGTVKQLLSKQIRLVELQNKKSFRKHINHLRHRREDPASEDESEMPLDTNIEMPLDTKIETERGDETDLEMVLNKDTSKDEELEDVPCDPVQEGLKTQRARRLPVKFKDYVCS